MLGRFPMRAALPEAVSRKCHMPHLCHSYLSAFNASASQLGGGLFLSARLFVFRFLLQSFWPWLCRSGEEQLRGEIAEVIEPALGVCGVF